MSNNNRVSLRFMRISEAELAAFAENVVVKLTGNASFAAPIVPVAELSVSLETYNAAIAAAAHGDRQAIAARSNARESLLALLRREAAYVQSIAGEDVAMLLSSGFNVVPTGGTRSPLPKVVIEKVINEQSTLMTVRLQAIPNARSYEVRMSYGATGWQTVGIFTQGRRIPLQNLTPGTTYTVQARAVGGSTGYSDWSDPISHMAT
jgi:hypothetical protein